jgi:hypothetical protein
MNETLNILVAYEDLTAEERAKELLGRLAITLTPQVRLKLSLWKFSVLSVPPLQDLAVMDAVEADVIIISSSQADQTPTELKTWMERWEPKPSGKNSALVALSTPAGDDVATSPAVTAYCQGIASHNGMDFFCDSDLPGAQRTRALLSSKPSHSRREMVAEAMNGTFSQTTRSSPVNGQCSTHRSMAS